MASDKRSSWVVSSSSEEKPWGKETSWSSPNTVKVKTFILESGKRNSFKFNSLKDELLVCVSGKIKVYYGDEEIITDGFGDLKMSTLLPGMGLAVQPNCPYRLEAIEDSNILEISTSSLARQEVVRLHDDYGRETKFISTHVSEIIKKWFLN